MKYEIGKIFYYSAIDQWYRCINIQNQMIVLKNISSPDEDNLDIRENGFHYKELRDVKSDMRSSGNKKLYFNNIFKDMK